MLVFNKLLTGLNKHRTHLILTVLLMTLLSCHAPETHVERCVINVELYKCRCHTYEINKDYVGRIGKSYDKPIEYCNTLVGFTPQNWTELRAYLGRVQRAFQGKR